MAGNKSSINMLEGLNNPGRFEIKEYQISYLFPFKYIVLLAELNCDDPVLKQT